MASAFPWIITYDIRASPVIPCGSETLLNKMGPNEDVRDLSQGDCAAPNLIDCVMCVGV